MAKILFLNPSKMGSGYTPIWVASHTGLLKKDGHELKLFDALFYKTWSDNYTQRNTEIEMYQPSSYESHITLNEGDIYADLQACIDEFRPDIIFWGAISSHIHSEGEYVSVQYGSDLLRRVKTNAIKIAAGIQPTADPKLMLELFSDVNYFIRGESEFVLKDIAKKIDEKSSISEVRGLVFKEKNQLRTNPPQAIIADMDLLEPYDYSLFDEQVFYRPYNGKVVRAVDYEMSRGCPYTCDYCVETVIQKYYGFTERTAVGMLKNVNRYLRSKSSARIFAEIKKIYEEKNVTFFRCQDTNFLTIPRATLSELATAIQASGLPIFLYIETRPEQVSPVTVTLLKKLNVDGVGTGIEVASDEFRETNLHRFCKQSEIIKAFDLLKEAGIKRTTYNVLGFCGETEELILETIRFNQLLNPDNISTSFYSPYIGTAEHKRSVAENCFDSYEYNLNDGLRSATKSKLVSKEKLEFFRKYFTKLVREGLEQLPALKAFEGIE